MEGNKAMQFSVVEPVVVFDTAATASRYTMSPAPIPTPGRRSASPERGKERIRVRVSDANSPKLIAPITPLARAVTRNGPRGQQQSDGPPRTSFEQILMCQKLATQNQEAAQRRQEELDKNVAGSRHAQRIIDSFRKRLQMLEGDLQKKSREVIEGREKLTKMKAVIAKATLAEQKADRLLRRSQCEAKSLKDKSDVLCSMLNERDEQIRELRQLIRQISEGNAPAELQAMIDDFSTDKNAVATMREFRHRAILNEMRNTYSINPMLRRMVDRQVLMVGRWERRRNEIQEQERNSLMATLEGMRLLRSTTPLPAPFGDDEDDISDVLRASPPHNTARGTLTVTHFGRDKSRTLRSSLYRYVGPAYANTMHNYDRKLLDSIRQRVGARLRQGVIATPVGNINV